MGGGRKMGQLTGTVKRRHGHAINGGSKDIRESTDGSGR
jgi:hypothetical protein